MDDTTEKGFKATTKSLTRILLVEDDPSDVVLTLAAFREIGLDDQVMVVNNGVQALDYLYARQAFRHRPPGYPVLVLLDLKLPMIDGFEVLEQIKSDQITKSLPVVVLTSSNQLRDLQRAYDLGANGYVVKTINFEAGNRSLHAIAEYWIVANEPPPGALPRFKPNSKE